MIDTMKANGMARAPCETHLAPGSSLRAARPSERLRLSAL